MLGEKRFLKKSSLPPMAAAVANTDVFEVYFSVMQQKSTKRMHQRGRTYGSSPLDTPNSLDA